MSASTDNLEDLRTGREGAREQMILDYVPMVHSRVKDWIKVNPRLKNIEDDLVGAGYLGLVKAIDYLEKPNSSYDCASSYIYVTVTRHIGSYADSDNLIKVPRHSEPLKTEPHTQIPDEPDELVELNELLDSCCICEEDHIIIDMRRKGYDVDDIGRVLDVSKSTVYVMLQAIRDRYEEL